MNTRSSQDNAYLLNQISRRYEDGDAAGVAAVDNLPARIAALTGDAIQQAAQTRLDTGNYVQVTLMPETESRGVEQTPPRIRSPQTTSVRPRLISTAAK